jgi:hypothetical protein
MDEPPAPGESIAERAIAAAAAAGAPSASPHSDVKDDDSDLEFWVETGGLTAEDMTAPKKAPGNVGDNPTEVPASSKPPGTESASSSSSRAPAEIALESKEGPTPSGGEPEAPARTGYGAKGVGGKAWEPGVRPPRTAKWRWPTFDPVTHAIVPCWIAPDLKPKVGALPPIVAGDRPDSDEFVIEVGRWGEALVYEWLQHEHRDDAHIVVRWLNGDGESGAHYDLALEDTRAGTTTFVEVKATVHRDKHMFEVSEAQFRWATKQQFQYHIYRVYGAGSPEPKVFRIVNPVAQWREKKVSFMLVC